MTSARIRLRRRLFPAGLGLLVTACQIDLSGLTNLFSTDPTFLSLPGRKLVNGQFIRLGLDGTDAGGASVVAYQPGPPEARLVLAPFDGGPGCRTGKADQYFLPDYETRSGLVPFIPYVEKRGRESITHFIGPDCIEPLPPTVNSSGPLSIPGAFESPWGFLLQPTGGDLHFVDPWSKTDTKVATAAIGVSFTNDKMWSIEKGPPLDPSTDDAPTSRLVVRDHTFKVLQTFGTYVSQFAVTSSTVTRAAYIDVARTIVKGVLTEEPDLYVVTDQFEAPTKIDSDVCNVGFPNGWHGFGVSYYSPCATKQLVLYGSAHSSDPGPGKSDTRFVLRADVLGTPNIQSSHGTFYAFYVTNSDYTQTTGTLWGSALDATPESIAVGPTTTSRKTPTNIVNESGSWLTFAGTTGSVTAATDPKNPYLAAPLMRWKPGSAAKQVATGVHELDGSYALVNYDGNVGDVVDISTGSASGPVHTEVPAGGILLSSEIGIAVLTKWNGTSGTLRVSGPDGTDFEDVAKNVTGNGLAFVQELHGVGYLADFDATTGEGTLGVRVIETGDTFDAGVRASEWVEVNWPEPGLLYAVQTGEAAGIWFARLK